MSYGEKKVFSIQELAPVIEQKVNSGGKVKFTVTGISMYPLLMDRRDQVIVEKAENINKYDIVLHRRHSGQYILHRVIGVKGDILTIAGDNELVKEYNVNKSQVVARVASFVRKGKGVSIDAFVYKAYSRVWTLLFPFRRIILEFLIRVRRVFCDRK